MVKEIQYTSIRRVLDNLTEHPMLRDLTLDQAVRYTVRFIQLHGYPKLYQDKITTVPIEDFRGTLPCDLVSIIQARDIDTGICLRYMTDTFAHGMEPEEARPWNKDRYPHPDNQHKDKKDMYIPPMRKYLEEPSYKTQGMVIFTSFPEGCLEIAYKSVPVDDDGFPMLLDNENYLAALEAYIKKQVFTVKFDTGKIAAGVLQNAQRDYAWAAAQLRDEMMVSSLYEMESITRMWNTMIPKMREFDNGFKNLGNREYIKRH